MLENNNVDYSSEKINKNITLLKLGKEDKVNVVVLTNDESIFKLNRELFNYLDGSLNIYSFWLINLKSKKMYYLEFRNKINWLATSFSRTNKDKIYFGKEILNNIKSELEIINILKIYTE